jgi:hypothetical protein
VDGENRSCSCESQPFTELLPVVPAQPANILVKKWRARDTVRMIAVPTAANNYTTIVEFDDNDDSGADWYLIDLYVYPQ